MPGRPRQRGPSGWRRARPASSRSAGPSPRAAFRAARAHARACPPRSPPRPSRSHPPRVPPPPAHVQPTESHPPRRLGAVAQELMGGEWTLHAIVYFWLIPAYIAFYTMAPRAAGGRLYSDTMGRLSFVLFLVYSMPVGMHHLFMDPEHGTGFKFLQMMLTALVIVPTLLTIFTISASMEI